MNVLQAIALKVMSALLFAVMSALVRYLGEKYPVGQIVFFRSAFAILPVVLIYAWRNELAAAVRTTRPLGHAGRGLISMGGMFCNFSALARLPIVDATAISFISPLITVALSAIFLKEYVRIYRWSAVIIGFIGILVMLAPNFDPGLHAAAAGTALGFVFAIGGAFCNSGSVIQTRRLTETETTFRDDLLGDVALTETETTSSIVFYFSLICALAGLATWPFGWLLPTWPELMALLTVGLCGGLAHILLTESYRLAPASLVAPFDYTSMIWAFLLGYVFFDELPTIFVLIGAAIIAAAGLLVIWRERQLGLQRARGAEGPPTGGSPASERFEGDDGVGILDALDGLDLLVDEMTDVGLVLDVELDQEVVVAGGRIDFGGEFSIRELVRHFVGFAELAFDLNEEGDHSRLRAARAEAAIQQIRLRVARAARSLGAHTTRVLPVGSRVVASAHRASCDGRPLAMASTGS